MNQNLKTKRWTEYFNLFNGEEWILAYVDSQYFREKSKNLKKKTFHQCLLYIYSSTHEELATEFLENLSKGTWDIPKLRASIMEKLESIKPIGKVKKFKGTRWLREYTDEIYKQATNRKIDRNTFLSHVQYIHRGTAKDFLSAMLDETNNISTLEDFRGYLHLVLDNIYSKISTKIRTARPDLIQIAEYDCARYKEKECVQ